MRKMHNHSEPYHYPRYLACEDGVCVGCKADVLISKLFFLISTLYEVIYSRLSYIYLYPPPLLGKYFTTEYIDLPLF